MCFIGAIQFSYYSVQQTSRRSGARENARSSSEESQAQTSGEYVEFDSRLFRSFEGYPM